MSPPLRHRLIFHVLAPAAAGVGLALLGPYGTFADLTLAERLIYWVSIAVLNAAQVTLCAHAAARLLPEPRWPRPAVLAAAAVVASLPATAEVLALEALFRPGHAEGEALATIYFMVLVITLPLTFVFGRHSPDWPEAEAQPAPAAPMPVPFFDRLPPRLGRDLTCLRAEDHYLRVHTAAGSELILLRMADAERELEAVPGLRVHRSWWVAGAAVTGSEGTAAKPTLILRDGQRVPVGRTYLAAVRAAGWLDANGLETAEVRTQAAAPSARR